MKISYNEFHVSRTVRDKCQFDQVLFSSSGNVILANFKGVHSFQTKLNALFKEMGQDDKQVSAGSLNAMGLIDEVLHYVCMMFRRDKNPKAFENLLNDLDTYYGRESIDSLLMEFMTDFPPVAVYQNKISASEYLSQDCIDAGTGTSRSNRQQVLEEMILNILANENPAFKPFLILFDDSRLKENPVYEKVWDQIKAYFKTQPVFGPFNHDLITMLKEPVIAAPDSLKGQLDYIRHNWAAFLGEWLMRLLTGIDTITEEEKAAWHPLNFGAGDGPNLEAYSYDSLQKEYERFSPDKDWMPKVVLMAKTVLVWLYQLSKKYNREISRLDQIPDEELDALKEAGFTGLWLIGLWERSNASKRIKQINGNPEAAASAYSLLDYEIAGNLGGWDALENLRKKCWIRGIRLASDMVPNHTGMDGTWVTEHPDYFVSTKECPFPGYTFNGENLSHDGRVSIYLEDHYYSKNDCAVCFKRVDNYTGDVTYIYHGNDGTGLPWNDTAQIDYLNPVAREAVMQQILKVAANFPIIRFDAAMVLAKKHIRRLWYPEPGCGGDIASRSRYALSTQEFENRIPNEFWREVVDRCAAEMPDTLLLAEAFWMMEGYFTRTLGMHRVYNSAFMNMLKKEENQKYRDTVKNTIKFDPQILKRFVNFMNNPDEETAVAQFGKGDKYFGVCTLMITMPGLPMFGHGQLEGFEEKYGMEYTRAYKDEQVDNWLYDRHRHDIFPLSHKRYLFSGVENFLFYDVWNNGTVNENIFAYSNGTDTERTIVFYNNKYDQASGWIKQSCEYAVKDGEESSHMESRSLAQGLMLTPGDNNYCIFREHRSGLWYIRKSDDIINNGMFVSLKGFEYQVYLDVKQVQDTEDGKYSKLCQLLNGSGTEDIEATWEEYCFKDLYAGLTNFIDSEFVNDLFKVFAKEPSLKAEAFLESVKDKALAYYELETQFSAQGATDDVKKRSNKIDIVSNQKKLRTNQKSENLDAAERYKAFCNQLTFLAETYSSGSSLTDESRDALVYKFMDEKKEIILSLAIFAAVSNAGKLNLIKWNYIRKTGEITRKQDLDYNYSKSFFARIIMAMDLRSLNLGTATFISSTYKVAKTMTLSEYSWLISGAHEYDGIRWFNKERMEESLLLALTAISMYAPRIQREPIFRLYKSLYAASANSEYKCEKFIATFAPEEKPVRKTAKKTTKAKTDGTKKETAAKTAKTASKTAAKKSAPKADK